jgi:hypothetical protein
MIAEHGGEWRCKICGAVDPAKIRIYHPEGFFNAGSLRVGPWCAVCGNRLIWAAACNRRFTRHADISGRVLLVSGSCACGKTTISYLMAKQIDAVQIDGDWILSLRKKELGRNVNFKEIDTDIAEMADGFIQLGKSVIIVQAGRD